VEKKSIGLSGEKKYRAICWAFHGAGGGSFMYALRRPELFSSALSLRGHIGALSLDDF